jgi:AcrR family transcriptional regulator
MTSPDERTATTIRHRPQQDRSEAKCTALVEATARLLATTQPSELTTRSIAAAAGVSPATVYRYFRDVDDLLDVVLVEHSRAATSAVSAALERSRHRTVAGVFHLVVDTHIELYATRPDLAVTWSSTELAERRRQIEAASDRSLAHQVGRHLVSTGMIREMTPAVARRLEAHWVTAGALLGLVLGADGAARSELETELRDLIDHFATRYH